MKYENVELSSRYPAFVLLIRTLSTHPLNRRLSTVVYPWTRAVAVLAGRVHGQRAWHGGRTSHEHIRPVYDYETFRMPLLMLKRTIHITGRDLLDLLCSCLASLY